jgi:hypothetical protein
MVTPGTSTRCGSATELKDRRSTCGETRLSNQPGFFFWSPLVPAAKLIFCPVDLGTQWESTAGYHRVAPEHPSVTESLVLPSRKEGALHMPYTQLTRKLPSREMVQPRCPICQVRMKRLRAVAGRPGFEHWTLRCTECGLIHEAQVPAVQIVPQHTALIR